MEAIINWLHSPTTMLSSILINMFFATIVFLLGFHAGRLSKRSKVEKMKIPETEIEAVKALLRKMDWYIKSGGKTWTFGDVDSCPLCLYSSIGCDKCPIFSNDRCSAYSPPRWKLEFCDVDEDIDFKWERYRLPFIKAARKDIANKLKEMKEEKANG